VTTALGLLGILVFVACIVAFAAGVTWIVVKLSPAREGGAEGSTAERS
jgi:hypothetical protein